MLVSTTVILKWNPKIHKHYVDLGYAYTHMGDTFEVKVEDLTKGSNVRVKAQCDYCGTIYEIPWHSYTHLKNKEIIHRDCCGNKNCTTQKAQEALVCKYGTSNIRTIDEINEKIKQTNLSKYGCENPSKNKEIQEKIKQTNLSRYGVAYSTQNPLTIKKSKETCMKKYGVDNYSKTLDFRESMRGENSPVWKDNPNHERTERGLPEYRDWRRSVFERDHYTCQRCGDHNYSGNGATVKLNAHHIYNFTDYKEKAFDVDNGITLCEHCHNLFHSIYGKKNNNPQQLTEFLTQYDDIDEKVC